MTRKLIYTLLLAGMQMFCYAQVRITGQVLSAEDNMPLPRASIRLENSVIGVLADTAGRFNLLLPPGQSSLVVSFLGYQTREIKIGDSKTDILIRLSPASNTLSEVVVSTGYQEIPAERSTGSFDFIDNKTFNQQVSTDVLSRLEAVTNSLTVDRTTSDEGRLMIRGLSTIRGNREPLIVLDNFPYEGDINNINPNDVESISVLKDAAAASVWGARAGNGVIVITTKRGKYNQPVRIEFNSAVTITEKPDLSYIPSISSSDFIDVEQLLYSKGYYNSRINSKSKPAVSPVVELLLQKSGGTLSAAEADARINALKMYDVRNDFDKYVYQPGVNQLYNLTASGGSGNSAWNLSGGYDKNISNVDAQYDRANFSFRHSFDPIKRLKLVGAVYYSQSKRSNGRPALGAVTTADARLYPYARLADDSGNPLPIMKDHRQTFLDGLSNSPLLDWSYYPLLDYKAINETSTVLDLLGNLDVNFEVLPGVSAGLKYQYQHQGTTGEEHFGADSYLARNLVNLYTRIDPVTGQPTYSIPKGGILDVSDGALVSHNIRAQGNLNWIWNDHSLSGIFGGEMRQAQRSGSSNRFYGYNHEILSTSVVDYATRYPTYITGSLALIPNNAGLSETLNRYVSLFANAAYTYQNKYTLSTSARNDASNLFGVKTNNKWQPLWSAGAAWEMSRENFYKLGFLPYLKLKATFGYSGNTDPSMAGVTTLRYITTSPYTQEAYAQVDNYANPELTWEKVNMFNLALDFRSKGNRITGSIEYYRKKATNLFGPAEVDYTTGIGNTITKNVASMKGSGVDVQASTLNINRSLKWSTDWNFSVYNDEVTDYYLQTQRGSNYVSGSQTSNVVGMAGKPVYSVLSYRWAGLDPATGNPQGYFNGSLSSNYSMLTGINTTIQDLVYHGSALPTVFGSVGNTFSWKKLSVSARITYKLGYYFRRESINYGHLFTGIGHSDFASRWQKPGDELSTSVPSFIYPNPSGRDTFYSGSEALVEKGDHIRLQYITASYELTKDRFRNLPFQTVMIFGNASDLGILWTGNKLGIDPEYRRYNVLKPSKTLSLGIRGSF